MFNNKISHPIKLHVACFFVGFLFLSQTLQAKQLISIRPQAGYGISNSSDSQFDGNIRHFGTRILLHADGSRKFGLELNRFQFENKNNARDFYSFGFVLEQTLANWFKLSVGTVGYSNYGLNSDSPVGIVTNLGWEPNNDKSIKPFIVLRNDFIFHDQTTRINSLSFGITWTF